MRNLDLLRCAALFALLPAFANGQPSGGVELYGFAAASNGSGVTGAVAGGGVTYRLGRHLAPFAEAGYWTAVGRDTTVPLPSLVPGRTSARLQLQVPLFDAHGGLEVRLPLKISRVEPYLKFGLGILHSYSKTAQVETSGLLGRVTVQAPAPANTDLAVSFGGGIRWHAGRRAGVLVETGVMRPAGLNGVYTDLAVRVAGGVFFVLR